MDLSQLHIHSIGYVAENKELGSKVVQVLLIEALDFVDGEIKTNPVEVETQGVSATGKVYQVSVTTDNTVSATWLPLGDGNRASAPDVRRGEKLTIWRVGETDKYYWTCNGDDARLRKLETVIYTFSDTQDEAKDGDDPRYAYYFEVSTHKGLITLHTCRENGEPFEYTIQLNTKEGVFVISDDIGNYVQLDSSERNIRFENTDGSWFELDKKNINFNAVMDFIGKVGGNMSVKVGSDISLEAGGNVGFKAGGIATMEGAAGAYLKSGGMSFGVTPGGFDAVG